VIVAMRTRKQAAKVAELTGGGQLAGTPSSEFVRGIGLQRCVLVQDVDISEVSLQISAEQCL
jgi:hypothetical protein